MKDKAGLQCAARVLNSVQKAWFLRILFGGAAPGIPDRLSCCLNLRSGTRTICASPIIRGRLSTSTCHAFLFLPASTAILASCSRDLPAAQVRLDETCGRTAKTFTYSSQSSCQLLCPASILRHLASQRTTLPQETFQLFKKWHRHGRGTFDDLRQRKAAKSPF